jgi:succinate dehydrogenase hydrophobic anchor subunit
VAIISLSSAVFATSAALAAVGLAELSVSAQCKDTVLTQFSGGYLFLTQIHAITGVRAFSLSLSFPFSLAANLGRVELTALALTPIAGLLAAAFVTG